MTWSPTKPTRTSSTLAPQSSKAHLATPSTNSCFRHRHPFCEASWQSNSANLPWTVLLHPGCIALSAEAPSIGFYEKLTTQTPSPMTPIAFRPSKARAAQDWCIIVAVVVVDKFRQVLSQLRICAAEDAPMSTSMCEGKSRATSSSVSAEATVGLLTYPIRRAADAVVRQCCVCASPEERKNSCRDGTSRAQSGSGVE